MSDSNSWRSTTALLSDFSETIPHARLKGYLSKAGGNKNLANELYSWDLDISSALWRDFHKKLERLRKLRNRIAHHEPIIDREINLDLNLIVEVCGTLDRRIESWIGADKRVNKILARYPTI